MARIELVELAHAYRPDPQKPEDYALRPMTMTWQDGGAYALLGPSGCGKTTLLNIISGLLRPSHGRVLFDGRDVTDLPTEARNIAQVFQFPVIYDTMTVHDNLAFPLRNRRVPEPEVRKRVAQVAELLELTPDLRHRASGLSADMKQKISLGRGLVRKDVAAILFDEPLTVIDPHLKWQLRSKLKQIHHELKLSLIYVTHDQVEALTFADQVVLMQAGEVVQAGTPQELFEEPAHTFVGYFIGSPGMNLLPCSASAGGVQVGNAVVPLDAATLERARGAGGLTLGIRPEFLGAGHVDGPDAVPAVIERVDDLGNFKIATATLGGQTLKAKLPEDAVLTPGPGYLHFPPTQTKLYADSRLVR
ncbi:glycerol transport system ATP-binding protein [Deinococcus metalli]|uniref:ABC transporter ATP-binding protein n=1 Tax=Deinococcus metalli TaxID=1141878 RepID=A0A7W8NQH6_9DEIO|nr:ABC transporter ATP-binding protein [Deinococcus metalli]MBB5375873.1 glycerol transport system ATP-binding protein [Deinococcus metalli]GHF36396.1 ABC transporter ATP-binding protein [Deinococcus metalli]